MEKTADATRLRLLPPPPSAPGCPACDIVPPPTPLPPQLPSPFLVPFLFAWPRPRAAAAATAINTSPLASLANPLITFLAIPTSTPCGCAPDAAEATEAVCARVLACIGLQACHAGLRLRAIPHRCVIYQRRVFLQNIPRFFPRYPLTHAYGLTTDDEQKGHRAQTPTSVPPCFAADGRTADGRSERRVEEARYCNGGKEALSPLGLLMQGMQGGRFIASRFFIRKSLARQQLARLSGGLKCPRATYSLSVGHAACAAISATANGLVAEGEGVAATVAAPPAIGAAAVAGACALRRPSMLALILSRSASSRASLRSICTSASASALPCRDPPPPPPVSRQPPGAIKGDVLPHVTSTRARPVAPAAPPPVYPPPLKAG
eukprot:scaffold9828_cov105-Isochrysis_galbana.AAC.2